MPLNCMIGALGFTSQEITSSPVLDGCLILFLWSQYSSSVWGPLRRVKASFKSKMRAFWPLAELRVGFLKQELYPNHSKAQTHGWELPVSVTLHQTSRGLILNMVWQTPLQRLWSHCDDARMSRWICHRSVSWLKTDQNWQLTPHFSTNGPNNPFPLDITWYCGRVLSWDVLSLASQLSSFRLIQQVYQWSSFL